MNFRMYVTDMHLVEAKKFKKTTKNFGNSLCNLHYIVKYNPKSSDCKSDDRCLIYNEKNYTNMLEKFNTLNFLNASQFALLRRA